jgi:hypothetical protein
MQCGTLWRHYDYHLLHHKHNLLYRHRHRHKHHEYNFVYHRLYHYQRFIRHRHQQFCHYQRAEVSTLNRRDDHLSN